MYFGDGFTTLQHTHTHGYGLSPTKHFLYVCRYLPTLRAFTPGIWLWKMVAGAPALSRSSVGSPYSTTSSCTRSRATRPPRLSRQPPSRGTASSRARSSRGTPWWRRKTGRGWWKCSMHLVALSVAHKYRWRLEKRIIWLRRHRKK